MRALTRATKLAKRMMDFVRATPDARPAIIDVGECLGDFEVLLRKVVPVTTRVEMNVRATARVEACRLQLETAILNLVVNARDASPIDGVIRVDVDVVETHGASGGGTYVLVSVEDEGAGVPPEVMGRLFEPFFTTKPPGKGTGLGLSNFRSFVDSAGGFMRIQSEVGQGTKVQLYLPVAQGGVQGLELKPGLCG
ncbi:MAG: hypothetical protein HUU37_10515 [Bdellovibrionales bacterium]|nr:hypothetical protein [Bdellovibrionales bacterium]